MRGELGRDLVAEHALGLSPLDDPRDLRVGLADLGQVGAAERVRRARDLDDDHLHQLGVVAVGVDDERRRSRAASRAASARERVGLGDRGEHHVPALEEQRVEDLLLGGEVVVDEPVGDARLVGDVRHPAGVKALAGEHAHGGVEDHPPLVDGCALRRAAIGRSSRTRSGRRWLSDREPAR